jgi:nicotinic acid phosphoribosyltransferase
METSLSDFKNLKNLKAAFSFWTDGSYAEILHLELILRDSVVEKTQKVYGIDSFCKYFSTLKFIPEYIHQLASLKEDGKAIFNESFLNYLQRLRFSFDLKAVSEAEAALPGQTILCIRGQKIELKIVEKALVDFILKESEANFELKTSQKPYKEIAIKEICQSGNLL